MKVTHPKVRPKLVEFFRNEIQTTTTTILTAYLYIHSLLEFPHTSTAEIPRERRSCNGCEKTRSKTRMNSLHIRSYRTQRDSRPANRWNMIFGNWTIARASERRGRVIRLIAESGMRDMVGTRVSSQMKCARGESGKWARPPPPLRWILWSPARVYTCVMRERGLREGAILNRPRARVTSNESIHPRERERERDST